MNHIFIDDILTSNHSSRAYDRSETQRPETGEIDRKHITRRIASARIAQHSKEEAVLVAGTVGKNENAFYGYIPPCCNWRWV